MSCAVIPHPCSAVMALGAKYKETVGDVERKHKEEVGVMGIAPRLRCTCDKESSLHGGNASGGPIHLRGSSLITVAPLRAPCLAYQVSSLMSELCTGGAKELGVGVAPGMVGRLLAYSRSVAHYPTAIKEVSKKGVRETGVTCCVAGSAEI